MLFGENTRAQLVAFAFLASNTDREFWNLMYNDEVMMAAIMLSIFLLAKGRPLIGTFVFSVALGLKAGALLLIPALLGSIQYNHGPFYLAGAVLIIFGYQAVIAYPFIS